MRRVVRRLAAVALLGACAAQGGDDGGGENLPNRGVLPYERAVFVRGATVSAFVLPPDPTGEAPAPGEPSALVVGDELVLYVAFSQGEETWLARTVSPDGETLGELEVVLRGTPEAPVGAPSITRDAAGRFWLAFTRGETIDVASSDDGRAFTTRDAPLLEPTAEEPVVGSPSLVATPDGFALFYETRAAAGMPASIALATGGPDLALERRGVVLGPGVGCTDALTGEEEACWDADGVEAPEARRARTATGRELWRLFYVGRRGDGAGLGFAAGFEPTRLSRFPTNPVLDERSRFEGAPTNVLFGGRYLLYVLEGTRRRGLALAVDSAGVPSEHF